MIENFAAYHTITTLAGGHQTIVGGPVASQEVIKDLGNNGGGFFNANSSHPFESPNPFTNIFEIFLLLLIPFSLPRTFGKMVARQPAGLRAGGRDGDHLGRGRRPGAPSSRGTWAPRDSGRSSRTAPYEGMETQVRPARLLAVLGRRPR